MGWGARYRTRQDVVEFVRGRRGLGREPGTQGGLCERVNSPVKKEYNVKVTKVSVAIRRAASVSKLFIVIIAIHGGRGRSRLGCHLLKVQTDHKPDLVVNSRMVKIFSV